MVCCYAKIVRSLETLFRQCDTNQQKPRIIEVLLAWNACIALFWITGRAGQHEQAAAFEWARRAAELEKKFTLPPHMSCIQYRLHRSLTTNLDLASNAERGESCKERVIWAFQQDPTHRWLLYDAGMPHRTTVARLSPNYDPSEELSARWFYNGIASDHVIQALQRFDPAFLNGYFLSPILKKYLEVKRQRSFEGDVILPFAEASRRMKSDGLVLREVSATYLSDSLAHVAASMPSYGDWLVALIEEEGLPLGIVNVFGETPLHIAFQAGNVEAARYLLKRQARIDISTSHSPTYSFASLIANFPREYQVEMLELLCEAGERSIFPFPRWPSSDAWRGISCAPGLAVRRRRASSRPHADQQHPDASIKASGRKSLGLFLDGCLRHSIVSPDMFDKVRRRHKSPRQLYMTCLQTLLSIDRTSAVIIGQLQDREELSHLVSELLLGLAEEPASARILSTPSPVQLARLSDAVWEV